MQLCEKYPIFWTDIDDRYHKGKAQARYEPAKYDLSDLENLIVQFSTQLPGILLFLDAINESNKASAVLQSLSRIVGNSGSIRIMMTSTEELDATFGPLRVHRVPVMTGNTDHDIFKYIVAYISHNQELSSLPTGLKEDIKSTLLRKSDGRYDSLFKTPSIISVLMNSQFPMGPMPAGESSQPANVPCHPRCAPNRAQDSRADL